jgi:hypothetical protein
MVAKLREPTCRKPVDLTEDLIAGIEDVRFKLRFKTDTAAIRHLLAVGIETVLATPDTEA